MPVLVGTSGWQYTHWRGPFYPEGLPAGRWLEHYAAGFAAVEIDSSFYRLPGRDAFESWAARVPDDFVFALKASRYLTHMLRLHRPAEPVTRLMEQASGLGAKLGPVLLQLPERLTADLAALEDTLEQFPRGVRVAVEVRNDSWLTDATAALLESRSAALCLADSRVRSTPPWRTAGWGYVRLHGGRGRPASCYTPSALRSWAERVAQLWDPGADVHVFLNNDAHACAVRDAQRFASAARELGLNPTRVPGVQVVARA